MWSDWWCRGMVGVPLSGEGTEGRGRSRLKHGVTSLPDHLITSIMDQVLVSVQAFWGLN